MSTLIVTGATSTDELGALGLGFAQRYAAADHVVFIDDRGRARQVKGITDALAGIEVVEIESPLSVLAAQARMVKAEYERRHPESVELAHAFVGVWLFYFGVPVDQGKTTIDYTEEGNVAKIRQSAECFLSSDFGRAPIGSISADGGKAPDESPARVPDDGGSRDDLPADR